MSKKSMGFTTKRQRFVDIFGYESSRKKRDDGSIDVNRLLIGPNTVQKERQSTDVRE
jgi:hypothetical protein